MAQLSTLGLIGRIGDAVIERFRGGAVEFLVARNDPAMLRLSVRFAEKRDRAADLARLGDIAATAGVAIERGWATPTLIVVEMPVEARSRAEPAQRVVALTAERRRPRLASRV